MKKTFAILITLLVFASSITFANVNENLIYAFKKAFPAAENAKWSEDDNGYFVSFTQHGILSKVTYDHDGNFLYALRYYKEENLPVSVLMSVRKKFKDKNIFAVIEVSTDDGIEYHIKLEDAKSWYGIIVTSSGSISVEERFRKIEL